MIEELEKNYGQKKYKLPNGIEIPFKQYMLEYVANYIDLNQNSITIKNGNSIYMKQFIEEFVLDECQKKYNGDLAKYLDEILLRKNPIEKNNLEYSLNEIEEPDFSEDDDLDNELSNISSNESFKINNKVNNFSFDSNGLLIIPSDVNCYNFFNELYNIYGNEEKVRELIFTSLINNDEVFINLYSKNVNVFDEFQFYYLDNYELVKEIIKKAFNLLNRVLIYGSFSIENQKNFLNDNNISDEIKYQYFDGALDKKVLEEYLEKNIDFTVKAINSKIGLEKILDNQVNIPSYILNNQFYTNLEMFAKNDIEVFRNYINSMTRICDVSFLDEMTNKRNDIVINSFEDFVNIIRLFNINSQDLNIKSNFLFTREMQDKLNEIKKIINETKTEVEKEQSKYQLLLQKRINKYTQKLEETKLEILNELEKNLNSIIIDNLFKENIHNVFLNLNEIILYDNTLKDNDKVVDINNLNFYKLILNLENMNLEQKLEIYNKFKERNIQEIYYDDIRNSKNDSYQKLGNSLLDIDKYKISQELTNQYGCNIYDMRDEEFIILTRCLNGLWSQDFNKSSVIHKVKTESFTLISNNNTKVFSDDSIIYGYNNIDINKINHVTRKDAASLNYGSTFHDNSVSAYIDEILSPTQISKGFNEINISTLDENGNIISIKPSYIICKDKIDEKSVMAANKLNLPIVLIKHKCLKESYENGDYYERDSNYYSTLHFEQNSRKSK